VHFTSRVVDGPDLYETHDWDAPETTEFEPALTIAAGSAIEFTCEFVNDRAQATEEGQSADVNEMCIFAGGYYPRFDSYLTEYCVGGGLEFSGDRTCGEVLDCYGGCDSQACIQDCTSSACPGSGEALVDFIGCGLEKGCFGVGGGDGGGDGIECVLERCGAQLDACTRATCE
jgi:hypothetical protein